MQDLVDRELVRLQHAANVQSENREYYSKQADKSIAKQNAARIETQGWLDKSNVCLDVQRDYEDKISEIRSALAWLDELLEG